MSASISFTQGGTPQSVQTFPASITVKPQPALRLEYVLPFDVFADQPLTMQVEPVEPFPLGVRVTNVGLGTARNFQIDQAQPQIVEDNRASYRLQAARNDRRREGGARYRLGGVAMAE